jgi:uncharacterized membrane protein
MMAIYLLALLIGVIAGLRTLTAPTAVSWAAWAGTLDLRGKWLAFLGHPVSPCLFTLLAIAELITDKLSSTPSRKRPGPFAARVVSGMLSGAAIGEAGESLLAGAIMGLVGAFVGTLGGAAARAWLAKKFGKDFPAAITEDVVAIGGAALLVVL